MMIGGILSTIDLDDNQLALADLNQDGTVDILDIIVLVNIILS